MAILRQMYEHQFVLVTSDDKIIGRLVKKPTAIVWHFYQRGLVGFVKFTFVADCVRWLIDEQGLQVEVEWKE